MAFQKGNQLARIAKEKRRNRPPKNVKESFSEAFDKIGGVKALVEWGKDNKTEFYRLATKLIPTEIGGKAAIEVTVRDVTDEK
jgi:hypothetical protein